MATESVSDRGPDRLTQEYLVVGRETKRQCIDYRATPRSKWLVHLKQRAWLWKARGPKDHVLMGRRRANPWAQVNKKQRPCRNDLQGSQLTPAVVV